MPDFTKITGGVFVRPSVIYQTQAVVIVDDKDLWVVDPGFFPAEVAAIRAFVDEHAPKGGKRRLLLTHSDFDHVAGAHAFADFQTVVAGAWDEKNEREGKAGLRAFDEEHYVEREAAAYEPLRRDKAITKDGQKIGGLALYLSLGHQMDGLVALHEESRTLLVGDFLSGIEFPFIYTGFRNYVESFLKMASLLMDNDIKHLVSEHGPVASGKREWRKRLRDDALYLLTLFEEAREVPPGIARHAQGHKVLAGETLLAWRAAPFSPSILGYHEENAKQALGAVQDGMPQDLLDGLAALA